MASDVSQNLILCPYKLNTLGSLFPFIPNYENNQFCVTVKQSRYRPGVVQRVPGS